MDGRPLPTSRPTPASPSEEALDALVVILDEVRSMRSRSRSELVARTGLGRAIVARRVQELLEHGLVTEDETGPSTGGRPPRHLAFRAGAGHVLVADLGATSIGVALTDLAGRVLGHHAEPAEIGSGPEAVLGRVEDLFDDLERETPHDTGPLWGVGVGVPGPVEFATGRPVSPPIMPGWDGYPIRARFAARFDAPVWVDNDVNVLALGEWRAGIAQGHADVVVIKVGTGIGAGIIADGRLHRGAQGCAGDVGHIQVVEDASIVCRCGNVGCLEALAGGEAIGRLGTAAALDGRSDALRAALEASGRVSAEDVGLAAADGDPVAAELLRAAGRRIGHMLASIVNFHNPSLIVIGGGVAGSGEPLLAAIRETVDRRSLPLATRDLRIERSSLGSLGGVIGTSALVIDQLFARATIERWLAAGRPSGMPDLAAADTGGPR